MSAAFPRFGTLAEFGTVAEYSFGSLADCLACYSAAQIYTNYAYTYYTCVFCIYVYVNTRRYTRMHACICLFVMHSHKFLYYTSDSLWKIWLVESMQSIHNSLWTWHDKCNICCRYCIYHVKFNICLVTKPLGVFSSETKWLNASLLLLRMNYAKNV